MSSEVEIVETLSPMHPGEVLREEFMHPLGLSAGRIATACGVPRTRIERIAAEETGVSGDTAARFARFFGTSPEFWMNLQTRFELAMVERKSSVELAKIAPYVSPMLPGRSSEG